MEARKLFLENGKAIKPHLCGKCGRIWESLDSAERCCKCSYCGEFCDWHKSTSHDDCQRRAWKDAEARQLESAALIPDYPGPFLLDDHVYLDVGELFDSVEQDDVPEFGFCTKYESPCLDIASLMDDVASGMFEDWEPNGDRELADAIAAWNAANANNGTYWEDRTRKWSKTDLLKQP